MTDVIIEDELEDILGKAMNGRGFNEVTLAQRANLKPELVFRALSGEADQIVLSKLAAVLNLNERCLQDLVDHASAPEIELPEGIVLHNSPFPVPGYEAMTVNSYSVIPPEKKDEGFIIDAGAGWRQIMNEREVALASRWRLFLTHTHPDHVVHYKKLSKIAQESYVPTEEPYMDAKPISEGAGFEFGSWRLSAVKTSGHSPGGMSYLLEGPTTSVAFVGDALFCYSIGKVRGNYESALSEIRTKLLDLPGQTILCPGHGPATTVEYERGHNPFFA